MNIADIAAIVNAGGGGGGAGGGGGYDAIIGISALLSSSGNLNPVLKKGSYSALAEKIMNGDPINVVIVHERTIDGLKYVNTYSPYAYAYDSYVPEGELPYIQVYALSDLQAVSGYAAVSSGGTPIHPFRTIGEATTAAGAVVRFRIESDNSIAISRDW